MPTSFAISNGGYGDGGAQQFFITEEERATHLYQATPGFGIEDGQIAFF